jgi:hypothetical protein
VVSGHRWSQGIAATGPRRLSGCAQNVWPYDADGSYLD